MSYESFASVKFDFDLSFKVKWGSSYLQRHKYILLLVLDLQMCENNYWEIIACESTQTHLGDSLWLDAKLACESFAGDDFDQGSKVKWGYHIKNYTSLLLVLDLQNVEKSFGKS